MNFSKLTWQEKTLWVVFGLYAILVAYGVTVHEPWRDEAQSYLMVRDNSLAALFKGLPAEGHPPLWYLTIFPFVKMGLPYMVQNWISAALVIVGMYLLLFRSNAPWILKVLIPFNYFFFYEYSVFARSYCTIVFLTSAIIALYPKRFDKPILFALCVAGLFNTHMLMFAFAASLTGIYLLDAIQYKKLQGKVVAAFAIMCAFGLYLIPYIVMRDSANIFDAELIDHSKEMFLTVSFGLLLNMNTDLGTILLTALLIPLATRTKSLLMVLGGLAGILYILGYKFIGGVRHCGLLLTVIYVGYALAGFYNDDPWNIKTKWPQLIKYGTWILAGIVVLQLQYTGTKYMMDVERDYSDSRNVADFIKSHNMQGYILTGYPAAYACTILPYLDKDKKMFYPEFGQFRTHYVNDSFYLKKTWALPDEYYIKTIHDKFSGQLDNVLILFNRPIKQELAQQLDLIYYTQEPTIFEYEMFCLYKFKKGTK